MNLVVPFSKITVMLKIPNQIITGVISIEADKLKSFALDTLHKNTYLEVIFLL